MPTEFEEQVLGLPEGSSSGDPVSQTGGGGGFAPQPVESTEISDAETIETGILVTGGSFDETDFFAPDEGVSLEDL